jgi:hypothetical protein
MRALDERTLARERVREIAMGSGGLGMSFVDHKLCQNFDAVAPTPLAARGKHVGIDEGHGALPQPNAGVRMIGKTPHNERATKLVPMIHQSVARMAGLINDVMDFARGGLAAVS